MDPALPPQAVTALTDYLAALDAALPGGRVTGVYLTGSAALGDWRPGRSDLDLLTVTDGALSGAELDRVAGLHADRPGRPFLDAFYVPAAMVGTRTGARVPYAVDGKFHTEPGHPLDPVLWATLHRHGVALRGPAASAYRAEPDPAWLTEWNLANLRTYWLANVADARARLAGRDPDGPVADWFVPWEVCGPMRLYATVRDGAIVAKTAAAAMVADEFPEWGGLARRVIAWRAADGGNGAGGADPHGFTNGDALRALELTETVVAAAFAVAASGGVAVAESEGAAP